MLWFELACLLLEPASYEDCHNSCLPSKVACLDVVTALMRLTMYFTITHEFWHL